MLAGVGDTTVAPHDSTFLDFTLHRRIPLTAAEDAGLPYHPDRIAARLMAAQAGYCSASEAA